MVLLKRKEVAETLKVSLSTVDKLTNTGKLTKLKAGDGMRTIRYDAKEVHRLFKKSSCN